MAPDALSTSAQAALANRDPITTGAYNESQNAAQYVLANPNDDPTGGALYWRFGTATQNPSGGYVRFGIVGPVWNYNPQGQVLQLTYFRFYGNPHTLPDF